MMPDIQVALLAISNSPAASIAAKATVMAALGLTSARLARGSSAAVRHALLAVAFGALVALPLASLAAPPIRIALRIAAQAAPIPYAPIGTVVSIAPADARVAAPADSPSLRLTPAALSLAAWIAGAALFLLPVVVGLRQVRRLRRTGLPWRHGQTIAEALALDAGVHRRIEVLLHEALPGPMTCGVLHPAIALPVDARNWKEEDLNRAMVHEIEHVRRGDWAIHCLARAVCAAYWFHPLVWMAWNQLVLEAERACDDAVLARAEATAYADQLLGVAQRLSAAARSPLLAMASRADLAKRVGAVLDSRQRRGRAGVLPVALACAAAAALVLTVAPLKMVAAPQSAVTPQTAGAPMPRYSAGAMLAMVNLAATDQNGNSLDELKASDFVITEDGAPQLIKIFEYQKIDATPQGAGRSPSSYYILGYYPTNTELDGKYRRINVTLKGNTPAKLDFRSGYFTVAAGTSVADSTPGPGVTFPQLQYKFEPEYSESARTAKYSGTVVLLITVDSDGSVVDIHVRRSLGLGLDEKAVEAVKQWRFRPGMKDLVAIPMQAEVVVNFRLL
jgi:TonB family protein